MNASTESENQITQLQQENELLLLQLHQVQEELEHYFLLCKDYEAKNLAVTSSARCNRHTHKNLKSFVDRLPKNLGRILWKTNLAKKSILRYSEFFDEAWYLQTYPDVAKKRKNPVTHYLRHGAKEGRNPGPLFDTQWYLGNNPDVAEKGMNPLLHYIQFGQSEGRSPRAGGTHIQQPPQDSFANERKRLTQERNELAKLASERQQRIEQLTRANKEQQNQLSHLTEERYEMERQQNLLQAEIQQHIAAKEAAQQRVRQLDGQLADTEKRQTMLNEEMVKAEAQIDLIKDILFEERVA